MDVAVKRRYVKKDFFQQSSGGYYGGGGTTSARHWEVYTTDDLQATGLLNGRTVEVTFGTAFVGKPVGAASIALWRMDADTVPGSFVMTNVVTMRSSLDWLTNTGFTVEIAPWEDLAGIYFEYKLTE